MSATTDTSSAAPADRPARPSPEHHEHASPHRTVKGLAIGVRLGIIFGVLLFAFGVFLVLVGTRPKSKVRTEPPPPITVRAVVATPRVTDRVWTGFGTVRSMRRAQVSAEVSGRVIERPARVEPGRSVDAGDLLVALDPTDYENALTRAEQAAAALSAQLDGLAVESDRLATQIELGEDEIAAAERDMERTRQAIEQGAGSQGELDVKLAALRRSQREQDALRQRLELIPSRRLALESDLAGRTADQQIARENLTRSRVTSPIPGEIQDVTSRVGDWVAAGTRIADVVDLSRVEVPLRLPASSASWVSVGDTVSLWTGEPSERPAHVGRVTRRAPAADALSRTITVFVEVEQDPQRADRLMPGAFVHGRVRTPDGARRVALPRRAIQSGRVMVLESGANGERRVRVHPVETDYAIDGRLPEIDPLETEWVVLAPGTEPPTGSLVAVTALEQLQPGSMVRIAGERSFAVDGDAEQTPVLGGGG